ncbi:acetylornithine/succinylornithine family transaminase [Thermocrinis sp.]
MSFLMDTYRRLPVSFVYGKGVYLYDEKGKEYLDFVSGVAVNVLGHSDEDLTKALCGQATKLIHVSNLYQNPWQEEVAKLLVERFWTEAKVFFCNSGAEANEGAIKLLRRFFWERGEKRYRIITFRKGFHGRTFGAMSATAQEKIHIGFEPLLDGFDYADYNDINSVKALLKKETGGIMLEVIQGEGGINETDAEFLQEVQELCKKEGLLLIIDEVQTGIGRTGKFYSYEHFELQPDIITLAKGLGGGFPIGCVVAREEVAQSFKPGSHGSTFGGNPLACACAKVVIEKVSKLLDHVVEVGEYFKERLRPFGKVRGRGLMLGLELNKNCQDVVLKALEKGLLINCTAERVLRFVPPLIVQREHVDKAVEILGEVINTC